MKHETWEWRSFDDSQMFAQKWAPKSKPKASIILIHGFGEHSSRYEHMAEFYTKKGIQVLAYDQHGHGKSQTLQGHIPTSTAFWDDLDIFVKSQKDATKGAPLILYGHSMGGMIVLSYILSRDTQFDGVIATAPLLDTSKPTDAFTKGMANVIERILPKFKMDTNLDRNALSRDKTVVEKYNNDPLVFGKATTRLGKFLLNTGDYILENAAAFDKPLLLMVGSGETIVSQPAIQEFAKKAPQTTLKVWKDLYHEIHNEPEKQEVFDFTFDWIVERLEN